MPVEVKCAGCEKQIKDSYHCAWKLKLPKGAGEHFVCRGGRSAYIKEPKKACLTKAIFKLQLCAGCGAGGRGCPGGKG